MVKDDALTKANKRSDLDCDCKLTTNGWVLCKKHKDERTFNITKQPAEVQAEHKAKIIAEQADNEKLALEEAKRVAAEGESKVTKFMFDTLQQTMTTYVGPSGQRYSITRGLPFKVENKEDVKFFKENNLFSKYGLFSKKPKPQKDVDELLLEELTNLKGISKKLVIKVVDLYLSEDHLRDVIFSDGRLDDSIPKKSAEIIIKYFSVDKKSI